jgi:small subunit ribosomal protein S1
MDPQNPSFPTGPEQAGPETPNFGDILSEFEHQHAAAPDQPLEGVVVAVTSESVVVNIGRKMEGVLPPDRFRLPSGELQVKTGDRLLVMVTGRNAEGYYELSTIKIERPKDWSSLERAFAAGTPIAGMVEEVIKGGLRVDVGVRAFLPASRSGARDTAEMEALVGQEIQCRIIKLDIGEEDVVVDRRSVLEEEQARARREAFDRLEEGTVVRGTVRSLTEFGAFVDIGGVEGLLHIADMSWSRLGKPSDLVAAGDSVEVKILRVNRENHRISLGLKQLLPEPWTEAGEKYKTGDRVHGKVTRVADFGAFVELEPGVEGLIHFSEMSWSRKIRKPSDIVKPGDAVEAVVLSVNTTEKRIGLGLKQALGDPWEDAEKKFPAGAIVEGPIRNLTNFGAFVELGDDIEGMIHVGDLSRDKRLNHPKEAVSPGQRVRVVVLEVDRAKRRIRLGMKQLEPTTVDEYIAEHRSGEVVTGRLLQVEGREAKVELGEGVFAQCRLAVEIEPAGVAPESRAADLSSLSAMLSAKWKQGTTPVASTRREPARSGQIRSFRIITLDPASKTIEVELAG